MRRFPPFGLPYPMILFLFFLLFIQGCARPALQTYPASEQEIESAVAAFARYRKASEEVCPCCLDAEADAALLVSGWFSDHTGRLSGYLQAMDPGYVKFIAINPLGQPLLIFVTDGNIFKSLNIFEGKAYLGSAGSETYRNFTPQGFEPRFSYYWLTGRLAPGDMRIQAVMHDSEQGKFWLQIKYANSSTESMVLFDSREFLILRHVLRDERGVHLMDVRYADYQPLTGAKSKVAGNGSAGVSGPDGAGAQCRVPAGITVSTNGGTEKIEVSLSSFLDEPRFSTEDFDVEIPDNFEQIRAK